MSRRILIVSPFPPRRDGLHGGCRAIAATIAELAVDHQVRVLCLRADDELPVEPALAELCAGVEEIRRPGAAIGFERALLMASALRHGLPFWVGNWRVAAFRKRLSEIAQAWPPDVVQFEFHVMAQYRDALSAECRTVLVVHEPGTLAASERLRSTPVGARILIRRDVACWQRFERRILTGVDAVVCLSDRDRRVVAELAGAARPEWAVIPPGISATPSRLITRPSTAPVVFFAGNFLHPPNRDAAMHLAREIFPGVRERCPSATLCIAGSDPPAALRALASDSIRITGRVPDMRPLLADATVVALPLRSGGGVRIKAVEALAAAKPVVATSLGVEGLGLRDGVHFQHAESDPEFTSALIRLLSDPAERDRLSCGALEWAHAWCRPGRLAEAFERLYAGLLPHRL